MLWGGRNGRAAETERLQAIEIRIASLAAEVQSAVARLAEAQGEAARIKEAVRGIEERDVARLATLLDATDKLNRVVERWRKGGASGGGDADDEAYARLAETRRAALGLP